MSNPVGDGGNFAPGSPAQSAANAGAGGGGGNGSNNPNAGKKAVHVKWAGKTIALGTFSSAEADEKCARAKALTRAWRSTMRPKPTREWVMLELERLGVRVVSGRLGRKAGDDDDGDGDVTASAIRSIAPARGGGSRKDSMGLGFGIASMGSELDTFMQQRRSSSLGLSMLGDDLNARSSLGSFGPSLGLDTGGMVGDPTMPPHRPLVGGGAAAAYEAARDDHYTQKRAEQQRRASSLGLGGMGGAGGGMAQMGLSVNPNQHYEMLKLHHMNLLNEIQETTLMMNLYQQQQLQQQQQQLQQAQAEGVGNDQMAMLMHNQGGMDAMGMMGGMGGRGSMGMGPGSMKMSQQMMGQSNNSHTNKPHSGQSSRPAAAKPSTAVKFENTGANKQRDDIDENDEELSEAEKEAKALEEQLAKLKAKIAAKSTKDGISSDSKSSESDCKRKAEGTDRIEDSKKAKTEGV